MAMSRAECGRLGGKARAANLSPERRVELATKASLAAAVQILVNRAPDLTPEQKDKLRTLLTEGA